MLWFKFPIYFFIVTLSVSLSACMVGPDFHSPTAPTVAAYSEPSALPKTLHVDGVSQCFIEGQDIPAQWWSLFHSPEINQLVETGLKNSPNLAAAQAALHAAEENFSGTEGGLLLPAVSLQLGQARNRSSLLTAGYSNIPPSTFNVYNVSPTVAYTFDIFGANRRQLEVLAAQVDYQRYQVYASYLTLSSNIVTTAIACAALEEQITATKKLIQAQQNQVTVIQKQLKLGGVSLSALLAQQTQLAQTQAKLPVLIKNLGLARDALTALVGAFPGNASLPMIKLNQLQLPKTLPLSLPSAIVKQRPDIQASEALLHQASANVGVATAHLFPQITLTAGYGWSANAPGALFSSVTNLWGIGNTLTQPIFNGGALRAARRSAIDTYQQADAQYKETVLQAFRNVADTLKSLETDALDLQANTTAEATAKSSLRISEQQLKLGGMSYLEVLNAQQQYQQTVVNKIQSQAMQFADTAALFQALGGGWWHQS